MEEKTEQQGYEAAIRVLREELRRHYRCTDDPCKDDHDFDQYGDAIARSIMAIRRLAKDSGSEIHELESYQ